jgi:transcriptional regulator with XRE-family HTH domain
MRDIDFEQIARQLLRAVRGTRSQVAHSRRLGFRSNVAAKWESGQRMPTAAEAIAHGKRLGKDPTPALRALNPNAAVALGTELEPAIAAWLRALKGSQRLLTIAERSGLSRYSVGRFLAGDSEPRLPQFLALLDALTDRLEDFVDAWVGIDQVPSLALRLARSRAARDALFQRPLCLAVMCLLDTRPLDLPAKPQLERLATTLDRPRRAIREALDTLAEGSVISFDKDRYVLSGSLTVDAHATPELEIAAKSYWTRVAHERARRPTPEDVCSYNVFSVGKKDYAALKELQREFYRGARALIAASEPTDLAGLLVVQLVAWEPT